MKKRLLSLFLIVAMLAAFAVPVHAEFAVSTSSLAYWGNGEIKKYDLSSDHSGQGWEWDSATSTLTLTGINAPDHSIEIWNPYCTVNVKVNGTNVLSSLSVTYLYSYSVSRPDLSITGTGTLELDSQLAGYRGVVLDIPTLIVGRGGISSKSITIKSGTITVYDNIELADSKYTIESGKLIADFREEVDESSSYYWDRSPIYWNPDYTPTGLIMKDENGQVLTAGEFVDEFGTHMVPNRADGSIPGYVELTNANPFTDVAENKFYYAPVLWAVEKGITAGKTATTFAPAEDCTRGQVVTFLWRAAGSPEPTSTECPFTDVNPNAYYYNAMLWAVEKGITAGMTATTFAPNADCNRGQVVTFLWRAQGKPAPTGDTCNFIDVKPEAFYYDAMLWAVENQVTSGMTSTTFAPTTTCNRGQVVTFLNRTYA